MSVAFLRRLVVLVLLLTCSSPAAVATEHRAQILILSAGDSLLPATRAMSDEIVAGLRAGLGVEVDVYVEFLDFIRFTEPAYSDLIESLIETKHGDKRFDLVYALGPEAYDFVERHRAAPYLAAPVVFLAMRESSMQRRPKLENATGIVSRFDIVETVHLAKLLQPGLRDLYVVTGSSDFDRSWENTARRELAALSNELQITYLADLPLAEVMARLGTMPARSALLYLTMLADRDGRVYMAPDIAEKLSAAAPVYAIYSTYLDRGIVGGYMDTFEAVGSAGAALGLRILRGEAADSIPPGPVEPQTFVVNWPAVEKWNLDIAALPKSAVIRNKRATVWDEYREQILVFVTLLALQSLLIIALLTQGRRRRLAESRLEESEARMQLAASSANLGMWRWDSDSNRIWMTGHCRRMLGLPQNAEVTIPSLLAAVHPEDRTPLQRQIEQSARWERPFDTECRITMPGGGVRWLTIKGQSTRSSSSPANQVTGVVIDVSERKAEQLEAEQQKSQLTHLTRVAILGELSGAMAHELNQPLAAILSNAQAAQRLLARNPPDLAETRAIMDDIVADDLRAGEVIKRLRTLLKRDEVRQERLDINALTAEVLQLARSELVTNHVSLSTALDPDLPGVVGDRIQLQQVLLNLIVNACEALRETPPAERLVSVSTRAVAGGEIEILLSDSGPGIAPEVESQLFEPFSTTKPQGLGLGLSISRAIVAAHNGHLRTRNNGSGGATFSIRLPADG